MNLQAELEALNEAFIKQAPPEAGQIVADLVSELQDKNYSSKSVQMGESVSDFSLPNIYTNKEVGQKVKDFILQSHLGEEISLSSLLKNGPVVLNFYRGGWCYFCDLELRALQKALPDIEAQGGQLIAISIESANEAINTLNKKELDFLVLSDPDCQVAEQFGVLFDVTESYDNLLQGFEIDLKEHNASDKSQLVIPATYVIDPDFTVRYVFMDEDYRKRTDIEAVVNTLKEIKNK